MAEELRRLDGAAGRLRRRGAAGSALDRHQQGRGWPRPRSTPGSRWSTTSRAGRAEPEILGLVAERGAGRVPDAHAGRAADHAGRPPLRRRRRRGERVPGATGWPRPGPPGVPEERVLLDPGHRLRQDARAQPGAAARPARPWPTLGRPLVVGVSRKGFLGRLVGREVGERLAGSPGRRAGRGRARRGRPCCACTTCARRSTPCGCGAPSGERRPLLPRDHRRPRGLRPPRRPARRAGAGAALRGRREPRPAGLPGRGERRPARTRSTTPAWPRRWPRSSPARRCALLERLAQRIAERALAEPLVAAVEVTVRKPHVALPQRVGETRVTVVRRREDP